MVSGHEKVPYGCHRSRLRGPLKAGGMGSATFDGVIEEMRPDAQGHRQKSFLE